MPSGCQPKTDVIKGTDLQKVLTEPFARAVVQGVDPVFATEFSRLRIVGPRMLMGRRWDFA